MTMGKWFQRKWGVQIRTGRPICPKEKSQPSRSLVFSTIAALCLICIVRTAEAGVQCTCPTIDAEGEGSTSCTASESNDKCTIDYNLFGERENRAARFLDYAGISVTRPDPNMNFAQFVRLSGTQKVDAVIFYLSVAASAQGQEFDSFFNAMVHELRQNYQEEIMAAFDHRHLKSANLLANESDIVISPGCVELRVDGFWVMFKSARSPYREAPRCGGRHLSP